MGYAARRNHIKRGLMAGVIAGSVVFLLLTLLSNAISAIDNLMGFNAALSLVAALIVGLVGFSASKWGGLEDYRESTIDEMMSSDPFSAEATDVDDGSFAAETVEIPYDYDQDRRDYESELVTVQEVVAPSVLEHTSPLPVMSHDELAAVTKIVMGHVSQTLSILPPLPSAPPTIHAVSLTLDEESKVVEIETVEKNLRDTLEASDLRDVIGLLGNQGYIDALQYCLHSMEAGSQEVALRAKGRVHGLGARGTKNEDGSTSFTRADVQKMLRKARLLTSANVSD